MNIKDKTKEQLINELQDLRHAYDALQHSYVKNRNKRKQVEEALSQTESNYRLLAQNSSDVIWTLDNDYRFTYISPSIFQLRGLTSDEAMRETIQGTMTPESMEVVNKTILDGQENERINKYLPVRVEIEQYHKDGYLIWVEISLRTMLDDQGEKIGYIGISRDITQRKMAEKALSESEARFRKAQEMSPDGFTILHPVQNEEGEIVDFTWIYENQTIAGINGTDPQEVIGKRLLDLFPSHHGTAVFEAYLNVANTGKTQILEEVYVGVIISKPTWLRLVVVSMGEDIAILGQDITNRRDAEEALHISESVTKALLDGIPESAFLVDANGTVIAANTTVAKRLKKTKENLIGSNIFEAVPIEVAALRRNFFDMAVNTGNQVQFQDVRFDRVIYNRINPIPDRDGIISSLAIIGIDITDSLQAEKALRESEEKLRELNAQKDKFFSIIAHDLKSPFNAIIGFSELLTDKIDKKDYHGIAKYSKIIGQSSQRAMDLLMNLLEWSRVQTGRIAFNPENLRLADLIGDSMLLLDDIAGSKAITIKKAIPYEITVIADRSMIGTVLRNLISNAIKFTGQGGEVNISAEKRAKEIVIAISDNGIGIEATRLEKLFRIDESYSTPGTNSEKGTGLGLILCKEFVEKNGGKIWVESKEGMGTTFYFTLSANAKPAMLF